MALSAREKMMALLPEKGWVLDATAVGYYRGRYVSEKVQNPYAWTRLAAHGGRWRIVLDYDMKGSWYGSTGDTLHGVDVYYVDDAGDVTVDERTNVRLMAELKRPGKWDYFKPLWEALENDAEDSKPRSLRQRAELIVKNPDLAVWLSFQAKHDHEVIVADAEAKRKRDAAERKRPLPLTAQGREDWWQLKDALIDSARVVQRADGRTDLHAAVAELRAAVEAIEAVLEVRADA